MGSIVITAILTAKAGKAGELKELLAGIIGPSRNESGCLSYTLHESVDEESVFVFYEEWKDEDSLKEHIHSAHYLQYRESVQMLAEVRQVYRLKKIEN